MLSTTCTNLPLLSRIVARNALNLDSMPSIFYTVLVMHTRLSSCRRSSSSCPEDIQLFRSTDAGSELVGGLSQRMLNILVNSPFWPNSYLVVLDGEAACRPVLFLRIRLRRRRQVEIPPMAIAALRKLLRASMALQCTRRRGIFACLNTEGKFFAKHSSCFSSNKG